MNALNSKENLQIEGKGVCTHMKNCIFCKIIAGEIPALKIYEDELVLAFMDIAPINFGHVLVIPKEHHTSTATIPEKTAGRIFLAASRIGVAMRRALDADGFNLHLSDGTVAGQVVMHAHLHVVPRWTDDGFHWNWRQLKYESDSAKTELQEKLRSAFKLERDPSESTGEDENPEETGASPLHTGNHGS